MLPALCLITLNKNECQGISAPLQYSTHQTHSHALTQVRLLMSHLSCVLLALHSLADTVSI